MSTILREIRAALDTRLESMGGVLLTAYEAMSLPAVNTNFPYQIVHLLPAQPDNPTLSEQTQIDSGIYQITVRWPRESDTAPIDEYCGLLQSHFAAGTVLTSGTISVRIVGTPAIAAGMPAGDRWAVPVSIRYRTINQT